MTTGRRAKSTDRSAVTTDSRSKSIARNAMTTFSGKNSTARDAVTTDSRVKTNVIGTKSGERVTKLICHWCAEL